MHLTRISPATQLPSKPHPTLTPPTGTQQLIRSGAFHQQLATTPLPSSASQPDQFRDEGATYRAVQKERSKDERSDLAGQDTEIQACERALSSVPPSRGAATSDNAKLKLPNFAQQEAVVPAITATNECSDTPTRYVERSKTQTRVCTTTQRAISI